MMKILHRSWRLANISLAPFIVFIYYIWQSPLGAWQAKCWDPEVGSTVFDEFCESLDKWVIPGRVSAADMDLPFGHPKRMVSLGQDFALDIAIVNFGKWIKKVRSPMHQSYVFLRLNGCHSLSQHIVSRCDTSVEEVTLFTQRWYLS